MSIAGKKILLGLTGGIACYKIPYLVRSLIKAKAEVQVVMTDAATQFITTLTMETVSGRPVATNMFPDNRFVGTHHIDLAKYPDLVLIAPATANLIGKVVSGISDDLLTTVICATPAQVMIAPAMNPRMWNNPITQKNFTALKQLGFLSIGPAEGEMACDEHGVGRMSEPDEIFSAIKSFFGSGRKKKVVKPLSGKRIIVTAGPCREDIDPVRFISNRSSGKMGFALARAAAEMGAETYLVSGPVDLAVPDGVEYKSVETTQQMLNAVKRKFGSCDCLIMAAAPADFAPSRASKEKIKKGQVPKHLDLKPTVDILLTLSKIKKNGQLLVGFALETENGVANAREKLKRKNLDLILLNNPNDPGAGFDHDTNQVTLIRPSRRPDVWPLMSKFDISSKLLDVIGRMM
ncbi:MAG: bifunctional phosphopantothenoylcysteine decarboxylase/phosphopantothenate--cysteine ligase CoaBC [candidate division Zixibacteria bacterium]